jgi:hypothetical protein
MSQHLGSYLSMEQEAAQEHGENKLMSSRKIQFASD